MLQDLHHLLIMAQSEMREDPASRRGPQSLDPAKARVAAELRASPRVPGHQPLWAEVPLPQRENKGSETELRV